MDEERDRPGHIRSASSIAGSAVGILEGESARWAEVIDDDAGDEPINIFKVLLKSPGTAGINKANFDIVFWLEEPGSA